MTVAPTTRCRPGLATIAGGLVLVGMGTLVAAAPPAATGTGWDLVFADEFNGTGLDYTKWIDQYPWGRTHNHDAYMAADHLLFTGDGTLTLRAERIAQGGKTFTSGAISTGYTRYKFTGGYFEARVLLPVTAGAWPAFWGLDNNWPPEADIMEFPLTTDGSINGYPNTDYHTAFHYTNGSGNAVAGAGRVNPASAGALNTGYHTYGMHWVDDTSVTFYFDGVQVSSFVNSAVAQMSSMYLILNHAVGGWPGTPSTTQWPAGHTDDMKVDYVRVWQQRPAGASATSTWNINGGGNWTTAGNWSGIVPKHSGQQVVFPRVGGAASAVIDWTDSLTIGGISFTGAATTTSYTIGYADDALQLAGGSGTSNAIVDAQASSQATQNINARLELYNTTEFRNQMTGGQLLVLNGMIIGDGDLILNGTGAVQFSNNNTYTGDTFIGVGQGAAVARVTRSNPFGIAGIVTIGPAGNATTARIEIQDARTIPNNIGFCGRTNTSVGIQNLAANNVFSGTISAQAGGANYLIQTDSGQLTLSGAATAAGGIALRAGATGSRTFTLQGNGNGVVSGIIENGAGSVSITKSGTGTWAINGANTFTGNVTVNGGTLNANPANAANGRAFSFVSGITVNNGGTLRASANGLFGWDGSQERPITVKAGGVLTSNGGLTSDVGLGIVTLDGGTLASLAGGATDWGSFRFDNPTDKLLVTADSTVSATNVKFGSASAAIEVATGKTLSFTGTVTDATNGGISYLTKTGTGTLTMSGANTHSGATTVNAGTLLVNGSLASSAITVASGATLGGTGSTGTVTIQSGGTLAPGGEVIGTITTGTTTASGTLAIDIAAAGSADLLAAGGPVTLTGPLVINAHPGIPAGTRFTIVGKSGPGLVSGTFAGLPEGSLFNAGGYLWIINYNAGDGNDVVVQTATARQNWQWSKFGADWNNQTIAGDSADPDRDGISNLLERAFGGNPLAGDPDILPVTDSTAPLLTIAYRKAVAATDIRFAIEESPDPAGSWGPATGTRTVIDEQDGVQHIRFTAPAGTSRAKFLRVSINAP